MSEPADWRCSFIERLRALAPPDDPANWDRATLAELRRGLGKDVSHTLIRVGWVLNRVPKEWALESAGLVAGLFALHPLPGSPVSLGKGFRRLREKTGSESVEKRFVHLLDSSREELDDRLRHAVSLLKAKDIAVDWLDLLKHVLGWDSETRWAQKTWATDFWAEGRGDEADAADQPVTVTPE